MEDVEERGPLHSIGTLYINAVIKENSMSVPQHIKTAILYREDKLAFQRDNCTPMFHAALFIITRK